MTDCPSSSRNQGKCRTYRTFGRTSHSDILILFGRQRLEDQALAMLRGELVEIISGTGFVFSFNPRANSQHTRSGI